MSPRSMYPSDSRPRTSSTDQTHKVVLNEASESCFRGFLHALQAMSAGEVASRLSGVRIACWLLLEE